VKVSRNGLHEDRITISETFDCDGHHSGTPARPRNFEFCPEPGGASNGRDCAKYRAIQSYRLAWRHISERQKREYPNVATFLHDAIRRQLKQGATEPVFIAAEALKNIEKLTGQIH
jgi:hypothetical protein